MAGKSAYQPHCSVGLVEDMKLMTPEIVWHSKEPVFSADFHRKGPNWRLATGGADNDIKVTEKLDIISEIMCIRGV